MKLIAVAALAAVLFAIAPQAFANEPEVEGLNLDEAGFVYMPATQVERTQLIWAGLDEPEIAGLDVRD